MKHKILISSLFVIISVLALFIWINIKDNEKENVSKAQPKFYVAAEQLIQGFNTKIRTIDSIRAEDIIGVEGIVKEISTLNNKRTIFLADNSGGDSSVLCDMQNNQIDRIKTLELGDTIRVKGVFKGFLKDVILLNCIITNQND